MSLRGKLVQGVGWEAASVQGPDWAVGGMESKDVGLGVASPCGQGDEWGQGGGCLPWAPVPKRLPQLVFHEGPGR